ncbi:hypothetical protein AJ79_02475 [Helicocarpus griseus UAMH5409]|uniref:EthD domain-containing protein n=1 Tax=Helicocarpus griseus UAMH5409 TaxID=1447875 RepID=A0A2B7Y205_9EURO|nr:hypothetical protein AJ79_02475 [Helicocarpus griseus UAMH5409]
MATRIDHKFVHPELSYDAEPNFQPCIKISVLFKKLESVSYETFFLHWRTVHADLTLATQAFRDNILRYTQCSQTPELKEKAKSMGNVLDFDACAQLWTRSWEDWEKFSTSPEYAAALTEDSGRFLQMPPTYMVCNENLIVGDASKQIGGKDGLSFAK